jgi:hypothetical protein
MPRARFLIALLGVLFLLFGCPSGNDDTEDDDVSDDDVSDDDVGDDDSTPGDGEM